MSCGLVHLKHVLIPDSTQFKEYHLQKKLNVTM